ncbi:MAG TPA: copper resistance protein CopC [Rhizomicrobium sp.]|nr:copper resistance protein CopC [Rhizomicrobium sp.]
MRKLEPTMMLKSAIALATLASFLWAAPGFAHVDVESSNPADKATVSSPSEITLRFSGPLVVRVSAVKLVDARGGQVSATLVPTTNSREIIAKPDRPLAPGIYRLTWTAAGEDDGHKMSGNLSFTVK